MGGVWYAQTGTVESGLRLITGVEGDEHPDGTLVTDADPAGLPWVWRTAPADRGLLRVEVPADAAPESPPMWFVQLSEAKADRPAEHLVGFPTDDFAPGTIVTRYTFATAGVHNDRQAGAVRWYRDLALVHQIFVARDWRRRNVGTMLLHVADAWHQANGWPGHLHSDGRRTDLGQQFITGVRHPQRFAPLTETMPPMDPA